MSQEFPDLGIYTLPGRISDPPRTLEEVPLAVGDPRVMYRTAVNGSLLDSFACMQNRHTGKRVVGILGAAQVDRFGNLNSTVIGDYDHPKVRFSGSGGAASPSASAAPTRGTTETTSPGRSGSC